MNKKNKNRNLFLKVVIVLWFLVLVSSLMESVTYPGMLYKHTGIDLYMASIGFALLLLAIKYFKVATLSRFSYYYVLLNFVSAVFLTLLFIVFFYLERLNYKNYVFGLFHVHFVLLVLPIFLNIVSAVTFYNTKMFKKSNVHLKRISNLIFKNKPRFFIFTIISLVLLSNIANIIYLVKKDFVYMINNPNASYSDKMNFQIGKTFFEYVQFVKDNTPDNAVILIPPQGYPWPQTGNAWYVRYFLYPRKVINGKEFEPGLSYPDSKIDYIMIAHGETSTTEFGYTPNWPKFNVDSEYFIYVGDDKSIIMVDGKYVYDKIKDLELWGLIKI